MQPLISESMPALKSKYKPGSRKQEAIDEALILYMISQKIPMNAASSPALRDLMSIADSQYTVPSRNTLTAKVDKYAASIFRKEREVLENCLAVSFAIDGWTERLAFFLAITVHSVLSDGTIYETVLPLVRLHSRHTALNFKEAFDDAIQSFLTKEQLSRAYAVTTDNASNMIAFGEISGLIWISCMAHTLNLFVNDVIRSHENEILLQRAHDLVCKFKRSTKHFEALNDAQKAASQTTKSLVMPVETRWNSYFLMCQRLTELKVHVKTALATFDDDDDLSAIEWAFVQDVVNLLGIFDAASTTLSASKTVTISLVVPLINKFKMHLQPVPGDSPTLKKLRKQFRENLDLRFLDYLNDSGVHMLACARCSI
jgi:hypothetical protein